MNPERADHIPVHDQENGQPITVTRIDPEACDEIAAYYQFEVDQNFSQVHPETTFEKIYCFRIVINQFGVSWMLHCE